MNIEKVVLVSPAGRAKTPRPPLGLMYIASSLEKSGYPTDIIDLKGLENKEITHQKIINEVIQKNPKVIGISCMLSEDTDVKDMCKVFKEKLDNPIIVVGSTQTTFNPQLFLNWGNIIDYVITGEGELSFPKLLDALKDNKDVSKVNGVAYMKDGEMHKTEAEFIKNLDEVPFPAWDKVNMKFYTKPTFYAIRGMPVSSFFVITSRGCNFRCTFCVNKNLYHRTVRARSAENVVEEIETLVKKYKVDAIYFYDDTFTLYKKNTLKICEEIKRRKLKFLWGCESRVDKIDEPLLKTMKDAGCVQIDFGVESGSQKVLDTIKKDCTVDQIRKAYALCRKVGIRTLANLMINHPGETEKDVEKTIELAKEIKSNLYLINVASPYPGSEIYEQYGKHVDPDEFEKISWYESYDAFLDFIDKNFKMADYNSHITDVLKRVWKEVPTSRDYSLKLNKSYFEQIGRQASFVINPMYLNTLIKSRRKKQYVQKAINVIKSPIISPF